MRCDFSFRHYKEILRLAIKSGYQFSRLRDFERMEEEKFLILLRHDIDVSPERALEFAEIESELGIHSTYFVRVHAKQYNPFNFKTYKILKTIAKMDHELGLHYENLDFAIIMNEDPRKVFTKEKSILESIFDMKIDGICMHRDFTGIDNSEFWKEHKISEFGVKYRAYENRFLKKMIFISDSLGKWSKGKCLCHYVSNMIPRIYALTHPCYWFRVAYHLGPGHDIAT